MRGLQVFNKPQFFIEDFFKDFDQLNPTFNPNVDIQDLDDKVLIMADLPGLEEKDINVEFKKGILDISGERQTVKETKGRFERTSGKFKRSFEIDYDIETEKIKAAFKNGVLTVDLPKIEAQKPYRIPISLENS